MLTRIWLIIVFLCAFGCAVKQKPVEYYVHEEITGKCFRVNEQVKEIFYSDWDCGKIPENADYRSVYQWEEENEEVDSDSKGSFGMKKLKDLWKNRKKE